MNSSSMRRKDVSESRNSETSSFVVCMHLICKYDNLLYISFCSTRSEYRRTQSRSMRTLGLGLGYIGFYVLNFELLFEIQNFYYNKESLNDHQRFDDLRFSRSQPDKLQKLFPHGIVSFWSGLPLRSGASLRSTQLFFRFSSTLRNPQREFLTLGNSLTLVEQLGFRYRNPPSTR